MDYATKIAVIAIIWSFGTAMFAICIPLVKITQSGVILPVILVICLFLSTITIVKVSTFDNSK